MKIRLTGATFDASAKTILHTSFSDVTLSGIQLIVNVTDNIIIYNFADPTKGGSLSTDTLTLDYDTTSMDDADELMILVEDGNTTQPVSLSGVATSAKQDTIIGHVDGIETAIASTNTKLDTVNTNLGTIDGRVDGLETLVTSTNTKLDTVNTNLGTIDGRVDGLEASNSAIQTSVQLIDDTVQVLGTDTYTEATSKGLTLGAVRRDADTTLVNTTNEFGPLQMDANGRLKVEAFSGETLPVSFTGSGDVATQTTLASLLTSSQLIDDIVYTDDTSTHSTGTSKGAGMMAVANPTDASVDANDMGMVAMTTARALKNDITSIAGTAAVNGSGNATGALRVELPTNGTGVIASISTSVVPGTAATNLGKARDSAIGATDTGIAMLGVRRDSPTAETPAAGDYIVPQYSANGEAWTRLSGELADDAAFTVGTTRVVPVGMMADETSTDSVDEGDAGVPRITLDRKQIVTVQPHTQGGLSVFNATSSDGATALTSTAQAIKASAGQVYGWYIYNPNATAQFVQLYNTAAASVTVGTTNPLFMLTIPATSAANVEFTNGITFSNAGFSCAATSTAGGSGAPGTALDAVIFYK